MVKGNDKGNTYDLIIVGAGAAGIIATGTAANNNKSVLVLEKMRSAGRKILISGKGRCNITNDSYASHHFKKIHPKPKFLKAAYKNFFKEDILEILDNQNLKYKTERGGRIFPVSDKSKDVLNALTNWAFTKNAKLETNANVKQIICESNVCKGVEYEQNGIIKQAFANSVIIATGGKSYPATGSTGDGYSLAKKLGHKITNTLPALVPVETHGNLAENLMGLGLKNVNASLWVNDQKAGEEFGELMFAHYGLTGPIILTLSRKIVNALELNHKTIITIDLKPALDNNKLDARLLRDLNEYGKKFIENIFKLWMPSKLVKPLLRLCEIDNTKLGNQISAEERKRIRLNLKELSFEISGHRSYKEAIITQGGISTDDIDPKTMESKIVKGLFFAGEVMDLDADTGGYNFQIAYSTGALAAISATN